MKIGKLVVLRGTYTRSNGVKAEHWLLGTLTTALGNAVDANRRERSWTGLQVTIDTVTKKIVSSANFPLKGFKLDGDRSVTAGVLGLDPARCSVCGRWTISPTYSLRFDPGVTRVS